MFDRRRYFLALLLMVISAACSPQRFFYYPNRHLYADPERFGIAYEIVKFPSLNGRMLTGVYFPSEAPAKGIVIHLHGNFGNVSNHFPLALFLVKNHFDVLAFDYEGYGASEGTPTPKNLMNDGMAAVRFVHARHPQAPIGLFGQSLGGATAIVVAAHEPLVRAVVSEAAFSGQRAMARDVLKRSMLTWPLYPVAPLFLSGRYDALAAVAAISPRPILFVHGDHDKTVPVSMSQALYANAKEPKSLWIVSGADHLECRRIAGRDYESRIAEFFAQAFK